MPDTAPPACRLQSASEAYGVPPPPLGLGLPHPAAGRGGASGGCEASGVKSGAGELSERVPTSVAAPRRAEVLRDPV